MWIYVEGMKYVCQHSFDFPRKPMEIVGDRECTCNAVRHEANLQIMAKKKMDYCFYRSAISDFLEANNMLNGSEEHLDPHAAGSSSCCICLYLGSWIRTGPTLPIMTSFIPSYKPKYAIVP